MRWEKGAWRRVIKGAQKQMIVLRTGNSRYFDEAYFVLKRDRRPQKREAGDMVSEANRILEESEWGREEKRGRGGRFWFAAGALLGTPLGVVLLWLCRLLSA